MSPPPQASIVPATMGPERCASFIEPPGGTLRHHRPAPQSLDCGAEWRLPHTIASLQRLALRLAERLSGQRAERLVMNTSTLLLETFNRARRAHPQAHLVWPALDRIDQSHARLFVGIRLQPAKKLAARQETRRNSLHTGLSRRPVSILGSTRRALAKGPWGLIAFQYVRSATSSRYSVRHPRPRPRPARSDTCALADVKLLQSSSSWRRSDACGAYWHIHEGAAQRPGNRGGAARRSRRRSPPQRRPG